MPVFSPRLFWDFPRCHGRLKFMSEGRLKSFSKACHEEARNDTEGH